MLIHLWAFHYLKQKKTLALSLLIESYLTTFMFHNKVNYCPSLLKREERDFQNHKNRGGGELFVFLNLMLILGEIRLS